MKDIKEIITRYIAENALEQDAKRGNIKLDPCIYKLVGETKPDQKETKKEFVFKHLNQNILNCYTVTLIDESQLVKAIERQRFFKGDVPSVHIVA